MLNVALTSLVAQAVAAPSIPVRLDQVVRSYVDLREFSGTVQVSRSGKVIFEKAYGLANHDLGVLNRLQTRFRIGSVTKQFTAALILKLAEDGKVNLAHPVKEYLPEIPEHWGEITILHLLTHESGIPSYTDLKEFPEFQAERHTPDKLLERFKSLPLEFKPGTKHRYSNSGYHVLGMVIEKVGRQTFARQLEERLLRPAGMRNTGLDDSSQIVKNRAAGYMATPNGFRVADLVDMSIPFSAGAMYSTVDDLRIWMEALLGGKILKPDSLKTMLTPRSGKDGIEIKEMGICMGLADDITYGRRQLFFGGGVDGFSSMHAFDPVDKTFVVALSNCYAGNIENLCGQLSAVSRGERVTLTSERKEIRSLGADLEKFVGSYALNPTLNLEIKRSDDKLILGLKGQADVPLFMEAKDKFFLKVVDAQGEFVKRTDGGFDLLWIQSGEKTLAKRLQA